MSQARRAHRRDRRRSPAARPGGANLASCIVSSVAPNGANTIGFAFDVATNTAGGPPTVANLEVPARTIVAPATVYKEAGGILVEATLITADGFGGNTATFAAAVGALEEVLILPFPKGSVPEVIGEIGGWHGFLP